MQPTKVSILTQLIAALQKLLGIEQAQLPTTPTPVSTPIVVPAAPITSQTIYQAAKDCLDTHVTLNPSVPAEVGCAEAVSYVLKKAGITIPAEGIASTATLDNYLKNSALWRKILNPIAGAVIVSPTGQGNGTIEGHTGIMAMFNLQYPNDWGILSNNSANGLFMEQWSLAAWEAYYGAKGSLPVNIYEYVGLSTSTV